MKLIGEFHGSRTYETDDARFVLDVDCWGNVKRIYKAAGIDEYHEINLYDAPAELRNARFEKDL